MSNLDSGVIPYQYREIFNVCSPNGEPVHYDIYKCLLDQCNVNVKQSKVIWDLVGSSHGPITRDIIYKTLALAAWAQQGKILSNKLFENISQSEEYPIPIIEKLSSISTLHAQLTCHIDPANLTVTYTELVELETINVELVAEKKGLFLKYTEYLITSKRFKSTVTRRYNDFVNLHELLLNRFPYRGVPRLPPKKIVSDAHFLETRRRGLLRWLTLVGRHPVIGRDAVIAFFLTDSGNNFQQRMKDSFQRAPDEFVTSDLAANAKEIVPQGSCEIATSRERVRTLLHVIGRLKILMENEVERQQNNAKDSADMIQQLDKLSSINFAILGQSSFSTITRQMHQIVEKVEQTANLEQQHVCEKLSLVFDVLLAHRDLCDRLERGLAHDHQVALSKMLALKKRKIQGSLRASDVESIEQLEAKMLTQEDIISNMELRSDFSVYCVHMENQLIQIYVDTLYPILMALISCRMKSHSELADIWKLIQNGMPKIFNSKSSNGSN